MSNNKLNDVVLLELVNDVAIIRLNRPAQLNAFDVPTARRFNEVIAQAEEDATVKAVIITGNGRGFCAGFDLKAVSASGQYPKQADMLQHFDDVLNATVRRIQDMTKPVVMAINGIAAGAGVGLALAGDVILMSETASFRLVFLPQLGIAPDMGGSWFLPRILGRAKALEILFTGRPISAEDALQWSMVASVHAADKLQEKALSLATNMAKGSTESFYLVRKMVDQSFTNSLDQQLDLERDLNAQLTASAVFEEGVQAFIHQRKPDFSDKTTDAIR